MDPSCHDAAEATMRALRAPTLVPSTAGRTDLPHGAAGDEYRGYHTKARTDMKAVVVYESHWGNTEAVARAIAEGIGQDARVLNTDEATPEVVAEADLIVAGAPVMAFSLPRAGVEKQLASDTKGPRPPDISHPLLRTWLDRLPAGSGWAAAFETRLWWSLRGATGTIESKLRDAGYRRLAKGERFIVSGAYGPVREDEIERARSWGAGLARAVAAM
jgi:hypothetical protein